MHCINSIIIHLTDRRNLFIFKNKKVNFVRLPKPYDTNCQDYGDSNRFECLNQCYKRNYYGKLGCIPRENTLYTYTLDDNMKLLAFCNNSFSRLIQLVNSVLDKSCKSECRTPCDEYYYEVDIKKTLIYINYVGYEFLKSYYIALDGNYFTKIIYSPSLLLGDLIINLTNTWSLWHGMSFITIVIELFELLKKFSTKMSRYCGLKLRTILEYFGELEFNANLKV